MSDESKPPQQPQQPEQSETPKPPAAPPMLPPRPEQFEFPVQLLEQWMSLPASERINAPLTRQDLDHLLFGLLRSNDAQTALESTLVNWSNGKIDDANTSLVEFRRLNAESQNHIRQFFMGLMVSKLREGGNAS